MATSIFTLLFRECLASRSPAWRRDVVTAVLLAALCALKNTHAVPCGLFAGAMLAKDVLGRFAPAKVAARILFVYTLASVLLLPWMLTSYWSCGTLFYPLLGRGYHGSSYGNYRAPNAGLNPHDLIVSLKDALMSSPVMMSAAVLPLVFGVLALSRVRRAVPGAAVSFVAFGGIVLTAYATGGYGADRYAFPYVYAAIIVLVPTALQLSAKARAVDLGHNNLVWLLMGGFVSGMIGVRIRIGAVFLLVSAVVVVAEFLQRREKEVLTASGVTVALVGMLLWASPVGLNRHKHLYLRNIVHGLTGARIMSKESLERYQDMQSAVPAGETVVVRLRENYALNFKRNRMFIVDYPGDASLPPGLPYRMGPESVAEYFAKHHLRYIAFSYVDRPFARYDGYGDRVSLGTSAWVRTQAEHSLDCDDNLATLGKTRERIYDDCNVFVIDLLSGNVPPANQ